MSKVRSFSSIGCALAALLLFGCEGPQGEPGPAGPEGPEGQASAGKGDVEVSLLDGTTKTPLANASLITDPATSTALTDSAGKARFKQIPAGFYKVVATLKGYETSTSEAFGVTNALVTKLTVSMARGKGGPAVTVTADQLQAGYGQPFTVKATAIDDADDAGKLTYKWTQTGGPKVTLSGTETPTITFTGAALKDAYGELPERFGVLGINPDQSGTYKLKVTVTDTIGNKTEATATIASASTTTGLPNVPLAVRVYLNGDKDAQSYAWVLTSKPAGSSAALADDKARNPSLVPDKEGKYLVTENASKKTLEIVAGTWVGTVGKDNLCKSCHNGAAAPDQFTEVYATGHGGMLHWQIDGGDDPAESHYSESCTSCHTVGYDKSAQNGGFDDVAKAKGWTFPKKLDKGNWDALVQGYPEVAQLGNIQCENCHGPQGSEAHAKKSQRVSFATEVCASCHQSGSHHYKPGLLEKSKHSNLHLAVEDATFENRGTSAAHCGRCHSGQGFKAYTQQLAKGVDPSKHLLKPDGSAADEAFIRGLGLQVATIEPVTCAACHDPHSDKNPGQVRVFDSVNLAAGFGVKGAGTGALCMTCHNTRNGAKGDAFGDPTSYGAPHVAAQTDVYYGKNAYFVSGSNASKHTAVAETCTGCHVKGGASFLTAAQTSNHTFKADKGTCKTCHSTGTDGEALASVIEGELHSLAEKLGTALLTKIAAQVKAAGSFAVRGWDPVTDFYSSDSSSKANVVITATPTKVELSEVHGQQGYIVHLPAAITFPLVDSTGAAKGTLTTDKVSFQLGSIYTAPTGTNLLPKSDPMVKAGWNYFLLHGDNSKGVHNPSFYLKVIDASKAALP